MPDIFPKQPALRSRWTAAAIAPSKDFLIFSDASFSSELQIGVSAVLIVSSEQLHYPPPELTALIETQVIKTNSVSRLELMSALRAIHKLTAVFNPTEARNTPPQLFSDCKNLISLPSRRLKLESVQYLSRRTGKPLANADLYRDFFAVLDEHPLVLNWIKGHSPSRSQNPMQKLFSLVDKEARRALRTVQTG